MVIINILMIFIVKDFLIRMTKVMILIQKNNMILISLTNQICSEKYMFAYYVGDLLQTMTMMMMVGLTIHLNANGSAVFV